MLRSAIGRGVALGVALLVAAPLAACSANGGGSAGGKIRLTVGDYGNFGIKQLFAEYERTHPNVEIVERVSEYNAHHQRVATQIAAGSGANDIEAVEEGFIVQFRSQPDKFVNLLDHGAAKLAGRHLEWKWKQSMSADGKVQIGLGTDVGGLGMCYRRDLFSKAGLPTDRDEVSKLWPDWGAYFDVGEQFGTKVNGAKWFDTASNVYNAMIAQLPESYFDTSENLRIESDPAIKQAFTDAAQAVLDGQSASLAGFSPQWTAGFQKGSFATITCPAWMLGYIKENAPASEGKWDVAAVPGGGGNWGGSFLTVPKQTKHPKEAYELAAWLTAPEQQLNTFTKVGNFPSTPELYEDPALQDFTNPFFNDAPVGRIYAASAKTLRPQYLGVKHGPVRQVFEQALQRVQEKKQKPDEAWAEAVREAKRAAA